MNEWTIYRTLVGTFIRMNARGKNGRTAYGRALAFLITYGISASYLGISLAQYYDPTAYVYLGTAVTMYIVGFTVMSTYSVILLDSGDGKLLAAYPIAPRTLFLARATNLALFVVLTVAPFALPLSVIHYIAEGSLASSLVFFSAQAAGAFWATGFFIVLYNLLMIASHRIAHIMSVAQVLLIFVLLFFYQSLPSITGYHGAVTLFMMKGWVQITPPMWFTQLHHAVMGFHAARPTASQLYLLGASTVAMLLALRTRWMLLPVDGDNNRSTRRTTRNARGSILHRWLAERSPATAAGASLFAAIAVRERSVRFQILPVVMMSVAVAFYGALTGELSTPFKNGILSWSARLHVPILVFYLSSVRHVAHVVQRAIEPQTVWMLEQQASHTLEAYTDGVARAVFWRVIAPQLVVLLCVFMISMPILDAVVHAMFLLIVGNFQSSVLGIRTRMAPFTRIENAFATMQRFAQFLVVIPFVAFALLLHAGTSARSDSFFAMLLVIALLSIVLQQSRKLLQRVRLRRELRPVVAAALIALLLPSCASQRAPEGGPPDTDPPVVYETIPAAGATRVTGDRVLLRFSEHVDRASFTQSLHISPLQRVSPEIVWGGRDVELRFAEPFAPDRTYVISVGSTVRDMNAGNQMNTSFLLAFSTGDSIDAGALSGRVFDAKPAGVTLFAWRLDQRQADTLDPSRTRPDYAVQSGADGSFAFAHLAAAPYRVLAVRDKQNNAIYDVQTDEYGTAQIDPVDVRDSARISLRFQLATEDTTAPYTMAITAECATRITWSLSETPALDPQPGDLRLTDSARGDAVPILAVLPIPGRRGTYELHTAAQIDSTRYILRADSVRDAAGNLWNEHTSLRTFTGSRMPDTSRVRLVSTDPAHKAAGVDAARPVVLRFSHPLRGVPAITLADSLGSPLPVIFERVDAAGFQSTGILPEAASLSLCIDLATCIDSLRGIAVADTIRCLEFRTASADDFGSLSGTVEGIDTTEAPAVVRVRSTAPNSTPRSTRTSGSGAFSFPRVQPGSYLLDAFIDRDSTGVYAPGRPHPFSPSARFTIGTDTVRVRARWENANIKLRIPPTVPAD